MAVGMPTVQMPSVTGGFEDERRHELGMPFYPVSMPGVAMPEDGVDPTIHKETKDASYISKLAGLSGAKPSTPAEGFVQSFGDPMSSYFAAVKDPTQSYFAANALPQTAPDLADMMPTTHEMNPMWDEFLTRLATATTKKKPTGGQ